MELREILMELKKPFAPEDHKERELPGGDRWFFIPWQKIRERLDDVYPEWEDSYSDPIYIDDLCVVRCTITICGFKRQGVGSAPLRLISKAGKDMSRGNAIERSTADAFKNAAEQWGIGRYLDDQIAVTQLLKGRAVQVSAKNQSQYTKATGQISREEWMKRQRSN